MRFVFRTDASTKMGSGHVMRCLTLAEELKKYGSDITFISRAHEGNLNGLISDKGMKVAELSAPDSCSAPVGNGCSDDYAEWLGVTQEQDARESINALGKTIPDWLIVDHYDLDESWEKTIRPHVKKIMVIDDLANRPHECDLLLDQNYYQEKNRYQRLVPKTCPQLLGPKYILFRKEFSIARKSLLPRNGKVRRILIFFGSSDPTNETTKALETLQQLDLQGIKIDVIIGNNNQCIPEIERLTLLTPNAKLYIQTNNMAELIAAADLAIGSGGSSIWERHLLGLPTITIITADHQIEVMESVEYFKTIWNLGWYEDVSKSILADAITHALEDPKTLITMSEKALSIFKINKPDWIRSNLFLC